MADKIIDFVSGIEVQAKPEEIFATQVFSRRLVEDYGYPPKNIQTRPQFHVKTRPSDTKKEYPVDIAVFSDSKKTDKNLSIIVECKAPNIKKGRAQLETYLTLSNARIGVWFNGKEILYLLKEVSKTGVFFKELPNIPLYGQRVEDLGLFKRSSLKTTHNLKSVFEEIRNYLAANNTGSTLDTELLPQVINILFCKIYDEKFTHQESVVQFRAGIDETDKDIADRVKAIFRKVKSEYADVFSEEDQIKFTDSSIAFIASAIGMYCLCDTERDVVADAFEVFITPSLRGGQGQFFTPRNVVKMLLEMTAPTMNDKILDPACGSGGFLVESLRYVWRSIEKEASALSWTPTEIERRKTKTAEANFRGIDKESFLSKTTKAYMAILGDGRGGVFCENSLENPKKWSKKAQCEIADHSGFDLVLTNPPYGQKLKISDKELLSEYDLGHKWKYENNTYVIDGDILDNQTPQVLFIERCINLLKPGGILGIVAPESMFCNPSHKYIMKFVESHTRVEAIISMPEDLFQPYTHAKTCVAILKKLSTNEIVSPYHTVFMAIAERCGHDSRGKQIRFDDLPLITETYKKFKRGEKSKNYDHLGFFVKQSEIVDSIYLPTYYNPEIKQKIQALKKDYDLVKFGDLVKEKILSIRMGNEVGKLAYGTGRIPFVRTSDIANWEIKLDPKQGLAEDIYDDYRERQDVKPNDILMVRDGTYLVGTCALISENDTKIVYQSHLYKIRCEDPKKMSPLLLLALLSCPIVKEQIRSKQFTQDIIDTLGNRINELILPIPKNTDTKNKIIQSVAGIFEKRKQAKQEMKDTLLGITPHHGFDTDGFMTLV